MNKGARTNKEPAALHLVFGWGFIASLAVIGCLIWLFAAYELASWWPWSAEPRLSQDKWFEIVRNAVTTAAALGVGVSLFFSYRRQSTAEKSQTIAAEAQLTASRAQETTAKALELSNMQHDLERDRRQDAVVSELRVRYAKSAEQLSSTELPVNLAGIYGLASLADDWADVGNEDERQVCIDLLCAHYRSQGFGSDARGPAAEREVVAWDAVTTRLQKRTPEKKFWGSSRIVLSNPGTVPPLDGIVLNQGGSLNIKGPSLAKMSGIKSVELNGGTLAIDSIQPTQGNLSIRDSRLAAGTLMVHVVNRRGGGPRDAPEPRPIQVNFRGITLDGATLFLMLEGCRAVFTDCVFKSGRLRTAGPLAYVAFVDCRFEGDVFAAEHKWNSRAHSEVSADMLEVEDCTFAEGVSPIVSWARSGS